MTDRERIARVIEERADAYPGDGIVGYNEVAHFRKGLREAARIARELPGDSGWISVDDRLPDDGIPVQCFMAPIERSEYVVACHGEDLLRWFVVWDGTELSAGEVTHWKPLPAPPEPAPCRP